MSSNARAQALLAHGATRGPCGNPGAGGAAACQEKLFEVYTIKDLGGGGCDPALVCDTAITVFATACVLPCATDADCRQKFPGKALVCRRDLVTCPSGECCAPG